VEGVGGTSTRESYLGPWPLGVNPRAPWRPPLAGRPPNGGPLVVSLYLLLINFLLIFNYIN
jgi:hypothetical protein